MLRRVPAAESSMRPRRTRALRAAVLVAAAIAVPLAAVTLGASPAAATPNYTHPTTTNAACHVYGNFPKAGIDSYGWDVGATAPLGVRYTFDGYAMIKDSTRSSDPLHWGFIAQSCLNDPYAYDNSFSTRLPDQQAVGGDGSVEYVELAPTPGSEQDLIHVTSPGTLRDNPVSFAIGNVRTGDPFHITTTTCGVHDPSAWIYGRDDNTGRWGYVQAAHFSACT